LGSKQKQAYPKI